MKAASTVRDGHMPPVFDESWEALILSVEIRAVAARSNGELK
jgi:hypothetical protein